MNAAVRIHRLQAEHRAPDDAGLRRCKAVQQEWLGGELEAALDGVAAADELLIVRRLQADLTLVPGRSDRDNARAWADAVATALSRTLRQPAPGEVLRFAGRRQAVQAFVDDAIANTDARDWAWQRIGLLTTPSGTRARRDALLRLLADDAEYSVPLLRGLLATAAWPALLEQLSDGELRGLAESALTRMADSAAAAFPAAPDLLAPMAAEDTAAARVLPQALARACWQAAGTPPRRWSALRLACMLAEPALARRGAGAVDAAVRLVWATAVDEQPAAERDRAAGSQTSGSTAKPTAAQADRLPGRHDAALRRAVEVAADAAAPSAAPDGHTDWGGLLLLLPLLQPCGALALLEDVSGGAGHALPLALHRLARQLLPLDAGDAAALAFCGRAPQDEPPAADAPPDAAQQSALQGAAALLSAELDRRLPDWRGAGLVERVARRRARVIADPGWIDVVYSLRDVSLELRRAALDLDPGFIPWLGSVLRFRYE